MHVGNRTAPRRRSWMAALAGLALCLTAQPRVRAQDASPNEEQQARQEFSSLWNVDLLMERAANNIARRYNLNETQRQQTHEMLTREVSKFLNEHGEIWPLVRDMARMQQAGEQPQGKAAQRLAEKATPLLRDIEDTIIEANMRWREILTEDQKRMHDFDLQDMAKTFQKMNDNFRTMAEGGPGIAQIFPEPNRDQKAPPRPAMPAPDFKPAPPVPVQGEQSTTDMWDRYVDNFIRDFRLDDQQSEAARSILKECKQRAEDYRRSKRNEFAQVEEHIRDANRADRSPEARAAMLRVATKIQNTLHKPIHDLFKELQTRLEPIPTEAQRAYARKLGREVGPGRGQQPETTAPARTPDQPAVTTNGAAAAPAASAAPAATAAPQPADKPDAEKAKPAESPAPAGGKPAAPPE